MLINSRGDRANHVEDLKQHGLSDSGIEFTDIEGRRRSGSHGRLLGRGVVRGSLGGRSLDGMDLGNTLGDGRRSGHFMFYWRVGGVVTALWTFLRLQGTMPQRERVRR